MPRSFIVILQCVFSGASATEANAELVTFFSSPKVADSIVNGVTSETITSSGYVFTHTLDKLFTGGTGAIIGRNVTVPWPLGLTAQAITTPPAGITDHKARIDLRRVDGGVFDLSSFTARLLANTFGTGGAIEIMPLANGEDAFADPLQFDVSGCGGQSFSYNTSPNFLGITAALKGFDRYKLNLFVDFALTDLSLNGAPIAVPEPSSSLLMAFGMLALVTSRRRERKFS